MRKKLIVVAAVLLAAAGILTALAPDTLSMLILLAMCGILAMGYGFGLMPCMQLASGFSTARQNIDQALEVQTADVWFAVFKLDAPFRQKDLDELFRLYRDEAEQQKEGGEVISDIEDWINEDSLSLRTWQGLVTQVPGILTGLGIIGTFVGLLLGISSIGFSSVEAALESISILRSAHQKDMREIKEKLDRIPKYSAVPGVASAQSAAHEQILMPQILSGMKKREFTFYLQPRVDLQSRKIVAAEALVRWNSEKYGVMSAADFVPLLERNGYIIRLDQYIWEKVFKTVRRWIDSGVRPLPIAINVSKTDLLAMDIASFFTSLLERYRVPPRSVQIEIGKSAYIQDPAAALEVETALRQLGFKVAIDGFDGDFISLNMMEQFHADELNLNLAYLGNKSQDTLTAIFNQARKLKVEISALGIENTEQITHLKRAGFTVGQGSYYYKPLSIEEFEREAEL